ncbi:hypothetical protein JB92DRAFT_155179 [Gautieria morchelliformis]|nr:hypothetical protein JB92DRAFT_155179 [Gautieria morchelliformis]
MGVIYIIFSDALAVLYVAALWKRNSSVFRFLVVSFVVTNSGAIISIGISMSMSVPTLRYYPPLNVCVSLKKPSLLAFPWACGLAFDFITLGFILWNAFDRPRCTPLRSTLRGDGIAYFMMVTGT